MTWTLVLLLGAGAFVCKVTGLIVLGGRTLPTSIDRCLTLIPAALLSALIVNDTFADGRDLVLDARIAGVAAAGVLAWRRAPLVLVIVVGAVSTAAVRAFVG